MKAEDITAEKLFCDWVESAVAEYNLACLLGIMVYTGEQGYQDKKGVFNTRNKVSSMLFEMLEKMADAGLLEKNDDYEYRWNKLFKGYWEGGSDGLS